MIADAVPLGAEQAVGVGGYGRRRRPGWAIVNEGSYFLPYCEAVMADLRIRMRSILDSSFKINSDNDDNMSYNGDITSHYTIYYTDGTVGIDDDTIKDGTEDANHNGKIDGDNGDGIWSESEIWTELNPNAKDTDGDTLSDNDERNWSYNPLSIDTDGDGLSDNDEDKNGNGVKDSTETSVRNSDTDGDGLSDKMEKDGWTVIIIYEATLEIKEEREVNSNPLIADYDEDGINDCGEFENGTDPNDDDTDDDGFDDKEEIDFDYGSSPTGIDGQAPTISDFDCDYELNTEISGPWHNIKITTEYAVNIWISADDIYGLEWVNVHLEGVGDIKIFTGDVTSIDNEKFEFTLSLEKAVGSLFNSFEVNITGADQNGNIGFKNEEVPSISDMFVGLLFGLLLKIQIIIDVFISLLISSITEIINFVLGKFDLSIESDAINSLKLNNVILTRINSLADIVFSYFIDAYSFLFPIFRVVLANALNIMTNSNMFSEEMFTVSSMTNTVDNIYNFIIIQLDMCKSSIEKRYYDSELQLSILYLIDLLYHFTSYIGYMTFNENDNIDYSVFDIINDIQEALNRIDTQLYNLQNDSTYILITDDIWRVLSIFNLAFDLYAFCMNLGTFIICQFVAPATLGLSEVAALVVIVGIILSGAGIFFDANSYIYFWGDEIYFANYQLKLFEYRMYQMRNNTDPLSELIRYDYFKYGVQYSFYALICDVVPIVLAFIEGLVVSFLSILPALVAILIDVIDLIYSITTYFVVAIDSLNNGNIKLVQSIENLFVFLDEKYNSIMRSYGLKDDDIPWDYFKKIRN